MSQVGLTMSGGASHSPPPAKRSRFAVLIALIVVVGLIVAIGFFAYTKFFSPSPDFTGNGHGEVTVQIAKNASIPEMGQTLQDENVVKSSSAFVNAASDDARARNIQPGYYKMKLEMSAVSALGILADPANLISSRIVVPEGSRATKVIEIAAQATGISIDEFKAVLKDPRDLGLPVYAKNDPEGFLFPATYEFGPDSTATSVLAAMVRKYNEVAQSINLDAASAAIGKTPYEVLTIASLIQGEGLVADYTKISRVIYNRLECTLPICTLSRPQGDFINGRLQLDSTINYAQGTNDLNLSAAELAKDGPFNTNINRGLPPTPIDNPGVEALRAALQPADGKWLYFVSYPDFTRFTERFSEHEQALKEYAAKKGQ